MTNRITDKIIAIIQNLDENRQAETTLRKSYTIPEILSDLDIAISEKGISPEALTKTIDQVLDKSVQTNNALFMNQMFGKQQSIAVLGDILTALLNTSMYTYEVAPALTLIEKECIKRLGSFIWESGETNDGVFTPGSSISNITAMTLARNATFPDSKEIGLFDNLRFSIFVSEQAHYSFVKGALFLGMGEQTIVKVRNDANGKIDIPSLNEAIENEVQNGHIPLMLVGIAGTTITGVYDNLYELSIIAGKYNMWFHVDGAYGGSLLFSSKEKHKLNGIQYADSVSWSLHKIMGVPLVCAVLLTKNKGVLENSFAVSADYLFHDDTDLDLGQKSLQCGRRADALKLWLAWKLEGDNGFEGRVDGLMNAANKFAEKINGSEAFELLCLPETPIVCFRFICLELSPGNLNKLNKKIRETIFNDGRILFNYSTYEGKIYLRCVISDPNMDETLMETIIIEVTKVANQLLLTKHGLNINTQPV